MPPTSSGRRPRPPGCCHSSTVSPPICWAMSLLSNYEGLRHQIERLVRENEELKKLVKLIRENHELKSAIKTQAGAMGISGLSNMLNEGAPDSASPTSDRVFPPSSPESTQDHGLDELGILSSFAEILNNSQSCVSTCTWNSPASSPLTGPLPRPLNYTIPSSVPILSNNALFSFLTGTLNNQQAGAAAVPPNGFPANPLPYSTAAPSSNPGSGTVHLAAPTCNSPLQGPASDSSNRPLAVSPMIGPTNSLLMGHSSPVASVGSPLTGSMASISPLSSSLPGSVDAPMAVPPATSPSSTLIGSLSNPPSNLLPNPVINNILLIDPNQPCYPLNAANHSSSNPAPSANISASTATVPKVRISTDGKKRTVGWESSSDVEPFDMALLSQPNQTSTPIGTMTVGTPIASFFGSPEASAQCNTSIPTMSSVLTSVPVAGTIPTSAHPVTVAVPNSQPTVDATSLHQGAPTSSLHNHNAAVFQNISNTSQPSPARAALAAHVSFSPPHPPPSPPPRSTIPSSSGNNVRGPRSSEPTKKNVLEMERKMAHWKSSKLNETPRDPKQVTWERLVGEIAFQLDRRILSNIFPERVRLYGFTVSNIPEKIIQASLKTSDHKLDEELCQTLTQRYVSVMNRLQSLGYNAQVHPGLTEQLVNAYGILRERPELAASEGGSYTMDFLKGVIIETVPPSMLSDTLLLLSCLNQLSQDDGKPMFIW
ncbi:speriolin [Notamacropus eugenii]|uniref:speriolin n=1 Tax=Notamacropus eugenii TaxID=9315 RepID=UPI003B66CD62